MTPFPLPSWVFRTESDKDRQLIIKDTSGMSAAVSTYFHFRVPGRVYRVMVRAKVGEGEECCGPWSAPLMVAMPNRAVWCSVAIRERKSERHDEKLIEEAENRIIEKYGFNNKWPRRDR